MSKLLSQFKKISIMSAQSSRDADETFNETLSDAATKVNKQEGDFL